MLLAFFNLSGKMFHILGPRNEILSDLLIHCPYWMYSELRFLSEVVVSLIPLFEKFRDN